MANVKNKSDDAVSNSTEDVLRCIYNKCKDESINGLQIPLELYEERVLYYTNVPKQLLNEILGQKTTLYSFDLFEKILINDTLLEMYEKKKSFSFKDIYEKIQKQIKISGLPQFSREMGSLGYEHINSQNYGHIVLENPKLSFERVLYLNKIRKLRNAKTVYYLDERIVDLNRSFKKPWLQDADMSKIDGYVFYHIVSKHGFLKGLFCNQPNAEDLIKWISDIVMTKLHPSSVIVMDNSPLHGKTENIPHLTRYHAKEDMLKWLQDNNIPCTSNMRKAELYELIARCPIKPNRYNLDLIFKSHGHEVVRLPNNYHDLSLTELMWDHINTHSFTDVKGDDLLFLKNYVLDIIKDIQPAKWIQFENTIDSSEKRLLVIDEATEEILDAYKIDLEGVKSASRI